MQACSCGSGEKYKKCCGRQAATGPSIFLNLLLHTTGNPPQDNSIRTSQSLKNQSARKNFFKTIKSNVSPSDIKSERGNRAADLEPR
ncbi:SEC-C metal-binding domain-containing protein [Heyndrickxia coagulans]|uniref:SEC-C metal-binding domain-containing protein n=1 Tax=Heyndrickxia coagulans TaxID=1398 RepID=UPI00093563E4|nr:SEC-C domain-containing protein [Heyndrickxia coagulans]QJE31405.1 hypothetical protein HHU11_01215 [Heyndrickxia coagulans]QQS93360.1 SEC-C domain-containing protein [Heyndrickxia coagulans]